MQKKQQKSCQIRHFEVTILIFWFELTVTLTAFPELQFGKKTNLPTVKITELQAVTVTNVLFRLLGF